MESLWIARDGEDVLDLDIEEHVDRLGRAIRSMSETAVYAELAAVARTTPDRTRSDNGFRALDPAGRPS
jgi:hypothetical protein